MAIAALAAFCSVWLPPPAGIATGIGGLLQASVGPGMAVDARSVLAGVAVMLAFGIPYSALAAFNAVSAATLVLGHRRSRLLGKLALTVDLAPFVGGGLAFYRQPEFRTDMAIAVTLTCIAVVPLAWLLIEDAVTAAQGRRGREW